MDNIRLILFFTLAFLGLMIYQAWQQDHTVPAAGTGQSNQSSPISADSGISAVPNAPTTGEVPVAAGDVPQGEKISPTNPGEVVTVETDLLKLEISNIGGTVRRATLLNYPLSLDEEEKKVEVLTTDGSNIYIAQSGLLGTKKSTVPTHEAHYQIAQDHYELADGDNEIDVPMVWRGADGITVTKHLIARRNSYLLEVRYEIDNQSPKSWSVRDYGQLQRTKPEDNSSGFTTYTYTGGVIYNPSDKYDKVKLVYVFKV